MNISEIISRLSLDVKTATVDLGREVTGGYVSDLLSDVMANSKEGNAWITIQIHPNIVAVASLKNLSGIIIVNGRQPEEETLKKASAENIPIMTTQLSAFEVAGRIYQLII